MHFEITFTQQAQKKLRKLSDKDRSRILKAIVSLVDNPYVGKKLHGELAGSYSIRVWPYRVVYKIYKDVCIISAIRVSHRKDVYK